MRRRSFTSARGSTWRCGAAAMRCGPPSDVDATFGPLNNAAQLERVEGIVERLPDHARILTGGHRVGERGCFFAPTVIAGLRQDDEPVQEELIGQRIREIKEQGVVAAASLTPQRVRSYYETAIDLSGVADTLVQFNRVASVYRAGMQIWDTRDTEIRCNEILRRWCSAARWRPSARSVCCRPAMAPPPRARRCARSRCGRRTPIRVTSSRAWRSSADCSTSPNPSSTRCSPPRPAIAAPRI